MPKYLDKDGLTDYTNKLTAKYKSIFASKTDVGTPLVAATAAAMTDTDKIYVYTGSETGYTAGNWYYYNGSAWVSGGIYNSTAVETDTTLSESGMAADAKATGDAIEETNTNITDLKSANTYPIVHNSSLTHNSGTFNGVTFTWNNDNTVLTLNGTATGAFFTNLYVNYSELPEGIEAGKSYFATSKHTNPATAFSFLWYASGQMLIGQDNLYGDRVLPVPSNAVGCIIRVTGANGKTYRSDTVFDLGIYNAMSNQKLQESVDVAIWQDAFNSYDYLREFASYPSGTVSDVAFKWNPQNTTVTINGTAAALRAINLYSNVYVMPTGIRAGYKYRLRFKSTNPKTGFGILCYNVSGTKISENYYTTPTDFTIPAGAAGMDIRIVASGGYTYTNDTISDIAILNAGTNADLEEKIDNINDVVAIGQESFVHSSWTVAGITFAWSTDGKSCAITGTASGTAFTNLITTTASLPSYLAFGETYFIDFVSTNKNITVEFLAYNDSVLSGGQIWRISEPGYFTIPSQATSFGMRLRVLDGTLGTGVISDFTIHRTMPNKYRIRTGSSYNIPLLVSFVDDDTTNDEYITRYYQNCMHNGICGNYAVLTQQIEGGSTTASKLIDYENDGFGMLIHCHDQRGDATNYWLPENRNLPACRENLATGLRYMQEYGFINYKYWITPYGVRDAEMISLARYFGLKCLATYDDIDANYTPNVDRYAIKRISLQPDDSVSRTSMATVKSIVDGFTDSPCGGWLIITTHFNTWGSLTYDTTMDSNGYQKGYSRFNEIAQYVLGKGCKVVPFQEGFSYFEPYFVN